MLLHNYLDSSNYTVSVVKNNLSSITNAEIQSIKKRVDFYVNHYKISKKKTDSESKNLQLDFLLNLNHILQNVIEERQAA